MRESRTRVWRWTTRPWSSRFMPRCLLSSASCRGARAWLVWPTAQATVRSALKSTQCFDHRRQVVQSATGRKRRGLHASALSTTALVSAPDDPRDGNPERDIICNICGSRSTAARVIMYSYLSVDCTTYDARLLAGGIQIPSYTGWIHLCI